MPPVVVGNPPVTFTDRVHKSHQGLERNQFQGIANIVFTLYVQCAKNNLECTENSIFLDDLWKQWLVVLGRANVHKSLMITLKIKLGCISRLALFVLQT